MHMSPFSYLKDKFFLLLLQVACMFLLGTFLYLTGYSFSNIFLILLVWSLILAFYLIINWAERQRYFIKAKTILDQLDQRYLLGELLPKSWHLEDRLYQEMIRKSNKSVIERIHNIEEEKREYKEYIEGWVHEIKAPITSITLICENRRHDGGAVFQRVGLENQKIENYADMALYYARSEDVYKDYMIQKTDLSEVVKDVLVKNRHYLIQNHVKAEVKCEDIVYTDGKWIAFILNQLILNSVKYQKENPYFKIYTRKIKTGVFLILEDNGVGIKGEECSRIFEKGFTGSNGRSHERATGMGLYLCKKLCKKLGIGLHVESMWGTGTKMILDFPVSNYLSKL